MKMTNDPQVPNITIGILTPALRYRFRVLFNADGFEFTALSVQVNNFNYDMIQKTFKCVLDLPLCGAGIHEQISRLIKSNTSSVVVEVLSGNAIVGHSVGFEGLTFNECPVSFDYSCAEVVKIVLSGTYKKFTSTSTLSGKELIV